MSGPRRRSHLAALVCGLAVVGAACSTDAEDPAAPTGDELGEDPDAEDPDAEDPDVGDGAGGDAGGDDTAGDDTAGGDAVGGGAAGTTMRVSTVSEAIALEQEGSVHVTGLLIDDGSGWRLCDTVLESYPPQCGGDSLTVEGLDPTGLPLEESGGVRWQTEGTVVGEVEGDTLVVTGSPASS